MDLKVQKLADFHLIFLLFLPICVLVSPSKISDESHQKWVPCKEDWFLFGDKCYKAGGKTIGLTWEQATLYCSQEGGTLATVGSQDLQKFLTAFLLTDIETNMWIGLKHGESKWQDGSDFSFSNWDKKTDAVSKYPGCVEMQYFAYEIIGKWNILDCNTKQAFLCQSDKRTTSRNNWDPRFCPIESGGGWRNSNSCYHIIRQEESWDEAEKYCQNLNGHLASVLDDRSASFLRYILSEFSEAFWMGMKVTDTNHQKWSSGWRANLYESFDDKTKQENLCLAMQDAKEPLFTCSTIHPFVCETSDVKPPIEEDWECPRFSEDWKNVNGEYCYLFSTDRKLKWFEANYECMIKGGALANIHSRKQATDLYKIARFMRLNGQMFIGLHRSYSNNRVFEWIDGSDMEYQQWVAGEPNSPREECAEIFIPNMKWNDRYCTHETHFICSAKKVRPEITVSERIEETTCLCPEITVSERIEETTSLRPEIAVSERIEETTSLRPEITVSERIEETTSLRPEIIVSERIEETTSLRPEITVSERIEETTSSCPNVTEGLQMLDNDFKICHIPQHVKDVIESALQNFCPNTESTMLIERTQNEGVSIKDEKTESQTQIDEIFKTIASANTESSDPTVAEIFIDSSSLTPEEIKKEMLPDFLLAKKRQ